ncbi:uncharacterized protein LOC106474682 [Limulus polyphemus]|uniref:Uncharacterized protein LOC106474682 n=1 Tax=Limulus polyphemus TaxID=6850 RepID=A0ABM1BY07_LIMPO|nr:uncharacterized protein LOC106474682 [Limulus polyphemus]
MGSRVLKFTCNCGNSDPVKFNQYRCPETRELIGMRCRSCDTEWLKTGVRYRSSDPECLETVDGTKSINTLFIIIDNDIFYQNVRVEIKRNSTFQVSPSRTQITSSTLLGDYLKPGDHISWHRPYIIWHHAIVAKVDEQVLEVIHWTKMDGVVQVLKEKLSLKLSFKEGPLYRIDYSEEVVKKNLPRLVLARAHSRLNEVGYNFLFNNCESFSIYCKTGVSLCMQKNWLFNKISEIVKVGLSNIIKSMIKYVVVSVKPMFRAAVEVGVSEFIEEAMKAGNWVGATIVLLVETFFCLKDIWKINKEREAGNLSRRDYIKTLSERILEYIFSTAFAVLAGFVADWLGGFILGAIIQTGVSASIAALSGIGLALVLGIVIGGVLGVAGKAIGFAVGENVGRQISERCFRDDRLVELTSLEPADHLVFPGGLLHPRHHAIFVEHDGLGKVKIIHNTSKQGVVKEWVDFKPPVYRVQYRTIECHPPHKVLDRARSKLATNEYNILWNNCKHFAKWCKLLE